MHAFVHSARACFASEPGSSSCAPSLPSALPVVVLDEFTSALDAATEHRALQRPAQGPQPRGGGAVSAAVVGRAESGRRRCAGGVRERIVRAVLIEENKIALESSSPSARLRAADWLATQSVTVPGYDPLGPARERRQALREWAAAAAKGPPKPMPSDAAVPDAGEGPR